MFTLLFSLKESKYMRKKPNIRVHIADTNWIKSSFDTLKMLSLKFSDLNENLDITLIVLRLGL